MPNLGVIRPADANETAVAWRVALETRDRPVALVLTRQKLPTSTARSSRRPTACAAAPTCCAMRPDGKPELILIASGSEVGLIVAAGQQLAGEGIAVRLRLDAELGPVRRAAAGLSRRGAAARGARRGSRSRPARRRAGARYVGDRGDVLGVDRFGASAPGEVVMREYGFTVDNVCQRARALLQR